MANFVFNVAKGRVAELQARVDGNDPTNSVLVVIPLATSGLEAQSALEDSATFAEVVDGTTNEATGTGWTRKVLSDSDLTTFAVDNTNNRNETDIGDQTWTAVADAADDVSALVICYDPDSTGGADTALIPLTHHDFVIQPDGSDVTAQVANYFRAS